MAFSCAAMYRAEKNVNAIEYFTTVPFGAIKLNKSSRSGEV